MERVIGGNERGWDTGVDSVVGKKGIVRSDYSVFPIRRPEGGTAVHKWVCDISVKVI